MSLKEKVIVIMGASSGIGEATSRLLAENDATLVLAARRIERLDEIKKSYPNNEIDTYKTDVTDFESVKNVIDKTIEKHGRVDVLYNNAGIMPNSPLIEGHRDDWQQMLQINIMGVLNGISAVLPHMAERQSGHIIATDSIGGHVVMPTSAVYSGTKFAVRAIMDGLRMEQAENNIKTTIISPGATSTDLYQSIGDKDQREQTESFVDSIGLTPEQVAKSVLFAIDSDDNFSVSELIVRPTKQTM